MSEVEFVIIGHAVKNVGLNTEVNGMWDQHNRGYNVLFEIDSVIKGNLESKMIIVKQFGGNCDQIFKFGEPYLIVGNQLEEFVNKTPKRRKPKKGEIPPASMPSVYSKTAIFYDSSDDEVNYWQELANEQIILNTSMCSSLLSGQLKKRNNFLTKHN
ncbi:hypothetical protein SYJ56_15785 [Algoriphagus sp. D3-2-R+10]|uniref:hypothetical protein n=1 Tax=Algoriphagus aurantiacus TaxID=3103948 RepID=UPI002B3C6FDF|nr:hypothetical protein [Algoriphagus sp. D3-2-R+10]MEB2776787.1 hypothetical protein [Algoriphagus sp. D3-2-R+10]